MPSYDVTDFLEDGAITLNGIKSKKYPKGHSYRFASPDFETGLMLKNMWENGARAALGLPQKDNAPETQLDDDDELALYRSVMGSTLNLMREHGVQWDHVQALFQILFRKWGGGWDIDTSLADARGAARGEAPARENRATRRSGSGSKPKAGSRSNRASTATKARTAGRASTRSSGTSGARAPKTA